MTWYSEPTQEGDWWQAADGRWYPPEQRGQGAPTQPGRTIGQRIRLEDRWSSGQPSDQVREALLRRAVSMGGTITNVRSDGMSARFGAQLWTRWSKPEQLPMAITAVIATDAAGGSAVTVIAEDALPTFQQITFRVTIRGQYKPALAYLCRALRDGIGASDSGGSSTQQVPAGWYPDPGDPRMSRYWDGSQWTDSTAPLS